MTAQQAGEGGMDGMAVVKPPAKINLSLRVLGKREDGFHEVETRMCAMSLRDELIIELTEGEGIDFVCNDPLLPAGEENLVVRAVRVFEGRLGEAMRARILLTKRIPSGAGLGGGSSDAASTLLALNALTGAGFPLEALVEMGAAIGSDVPFFLYETVCDCRGRGEVVALVAFDWELPVMLVKPPFAVAAAWAYQRWESAAEIAGVSYAPQICYWGPVVNDLERPVFLKHLHLAEMKMWLLEQEEVHAVSLSGSGSAMIAILSEEHVGERLAQKVRARYGEAMWTHVGHTLAGEAG